MTTGISLLGARNAVNQTSSLLNMPSLIDRKFGFTTPFTTRVTTRSLRTRTNYYSQQTTQTTIKLQGLETNIAEITETLKNCNKVMDRVEARLNVAMAIATVLWAFTV
jgi:hypothetical protein